jgi:hypothetical protein
MGKAKGETYAALRAHIAKWRKGRGFNANPLGEQQESIRWLCERLERMANEGRGRRGAAE